MRFALSTNWNSHRHEDGAAMLDEIRALGFDRVELGYALTFRQAEDVKAAVSAGSIAVTSVHAFCPNPLPGSDAGPEPYCLCDKEDWKRGKRGFNALMDTARFAAETGAKRVVVHAGRTNLPGFLCLGNGGGSGAARKLDRLVCNGKRGTDAYVKTLTKFTIKREKASERLMPALREQLDAALPEFQSLGLTLCLENLPTADGFPNEPEMDMLLRAYEGAPLAYWHDIGHGCRREQLGLVHVAGFLKRVAPKLGGFHVHDVRAPLSDHSMPSNEKPGLVKFDILKQFADSDIPFVIEPSKKTTAEEIQTALPILSAAAGLA